MYSLLSMSKRLSLPPILVVVAIQLLFTHNVSCLNTTNAYLNHKCYVTQGKYKPGSEYEKELTRITHNISSTSDFSRGYKMISLGGKGNFVSVILQCRGDSYGPKCRSCYAIALSGLRKRCPKHKGGIIWYDQCLLEFSGIDTVYQNDYHNNLCMTNPKNMTGVKDWFQKWSFFLINVTTIATEEEYNNPIPLYGAGERNFGELTIYAMMQCTGDLSKKGCEECFTKHLILFQDCLRSKQGGRVLGRSCNFRFELYPFVSNSRKM